MIESKAASSRRAILTAGLAAVAAAAVQAVSRPLGARAATGSNLIVGTPNTSTSTTGLDTTTGYGLHATSAGTGQTAAGLVGQSMSDGTGVIGTSGSVAIVAAGEKTGVIGFANQDAGAIGVFGSSPDGIAIVADSTTGRGLHATTQSPTDTGVLGRNLGDGTGVFGYSGAIAPPARSAKTGVYGYAVQDTSSRGVLGRSTTGRGVAGTATSGRGVHGDATSGTAGYFSASTGYALQTSGRVRLGGSSGVAVIVSGARSVSVVPGIDLTASSIILTTLQGDAGGTTTIQRVAVDTVANSFAIYLSANSVRSVRVGWAILS
jgi:hypothetical protein